MPADKAKKASRGHKSGQARVLTDEQKTHLFRVIPQHRHPEKNMAIMQVSFKWGLRAQEIALLQLKEVCKLHPYRHSLPRGFDLVEVMALPAAYTKGSSALNRSKGGSMPCGTKTYAKGKYGRFVPDLANCLLNHKFGDSKIRSFPVSIKWVLSG